MSDPKRAKALRTIASLQRVVDHPNTGDGEREAAKGRIAALKAKWNVQDAPPKPPPRVRVHRDYTGGFNSTSSSFTQDSWARFFGDEPMPGESEADAQARKIRRQQEEYEAWKKMNDAMLKRQQEETRRRKAREAKEAERRRMEYEARQKAQRAWEAKMADKDAMGRPLTDAEREEARRDPLGWAIKQDGRTAEQKNQDLQDTYTHKPKAKRCTTKETFFDSGGEPRLRNQFPITCDRCGVLMDAGEGCIFQVAGVWTGRCCESVPGPRRKKQRR